MLDYEKRLNGNQQAKEAKYNKTLPLQRPNTKDNTPVGTGGQSAMVMAGTPKDPSASPEMPENDFTKLMKLYTEDQSTRFNAEEFAAVMRSKQKELAGLNLPQDILEDEVRGAIQMFIPNQTKINKGPLDLGGFKGNDNGEDEDDPTNSGGF